MDSIQLIPNQSQKFQRFYKLERTNFLLHKSSLARNPVALSSLLSITSNSANSQDFDEPSRKLTFNKSKRLTKKQNRFGICVSGIPPQSKQATGFKTKDVARCTHISKFIPILDPLSAKNYNRRAEIFTERRFSSISTHEAPKIHRKIKIEVPLIGWNV